jgi:hypothetical protein
VQFGRYWVAGPMGLRREQMDWLLGRRLVFAVQTSGNLTRLGARA